MEEFVGDGIPLTEAHTRENDKCVISNLNGSCNFQSPSINSRQDYRSQGPHLSQLPLQDLLSHRQGLAEFLTLPMPATGSGQQATQTLPQISMMNGHSLIPGHGSLATTPISVTNSEPFVPPSLPSPFGMNFGQPMQPLQFSGEDRDGTSSLFAAAIKAAAAQALPSSSQLSSALQYPHLFSSQSAASALTAAGAALRGLPPRAGALTLPLAMPPLAGYPPSVIESLRAAAAVTASAAPGAPEQSAEDAGPQPPATNPSSSSGGYAANSSAAALDAIPPAPAPPAPAAAPTSADPPATAPASTAPSTSAGGDRYKSRWSEGEIARLREGVRMFGDGPGAGGRKGDGDHSWDQILLAFEFQPRRTARDLKARADKRRAVTRRDAP